MAAAAEAAHSGSRRLVLTARAENHIRGRDDLADTIARLQRYAEAGADVLYAPGLTRASDIREVVRSVDRPVNVLALADAPTVAELAALGVARISVGGAFAFAALGALAEAARELQTAGTYGFWRHAAIGRQAARAAFSALAAASCDPRSGRQAEPGVEGLVVAARHPVRRGGEHRAARVDQDVIEGQQGRAAAGLRPPGRVPARGPPGWPRRRAPGAAAGGTARDRAWR